jgi:cyclomaltodextrinase
MSGVEWFSDSVIYHILIDRFAGFHSTEHADQPVFLGGNIRGIITNLEYLIDLGITTLWISPFYKASAYHGYHITDFTSCDPHFGSLEDLKDLIHTCHEQDLRLLADFVPNHCSKEHPFFKDAQQHKDSPYREWFYFTNWPKEYLCFLSIRDLPKLNLDNPAAREHLLHAADYWLSLGFDGFRLDHVIGPSHQFWQAFTKEIHDKHPTAVLIGEAWMMGIKRHELRTLHVRNKYLKWLSGASSDSLFKEYIGELNGVLDFKVQELLKKYAITSTVSQEMLTQTLNHHYAHFPETYYLPTFLDNHDMDRFLFTCGNDKEKLKAAATIQFSLPQPPIIYYGTETGMTQTTSLWGTPGTSDLLARQPMNWDTQDKELLSFYKQLIQKRIKK